MLAGGVDAKYFGQVLPEAVRGILYDVVNLAVFGFPVAAKPLAALPANP